MSPVGEDSKFALILAGAADAKAKASEGEITWGTLAATDGARSEGLVDIERLRRFVRGGGGIAAMV